MDQTVAANGNDVLRLGALDCRGDIVGTGAVDPFHPDTQIEKARFDRITMRPASARRWIDEEMDRTHERTLAGGPEPVVHTRSPVRSCAIPSVSWRRSAFAMPASVSICTISAGGGR